LLETIDMSGFGNFYQTFRACMLDANKIERSQLS